ncbi:MAG: hypothetical protein HKO56_06770 [Bacteroidia bacterium]|nr:hypothetical protein [Bacteroidia bacterium]NNM16342.1 hypothetical protein [Bacteroidia bacterium]
MKKFTITFSVVQLFTFFLAIAVISSTYSFVLSDKKDKLIYDVVSVEDANTYFKNNRNAEQPNGGDTWGVAVTKDQFEAMKKLDRQVDASAFRCYFAKNGSGQDVSIIVGVDLENKDITTELKLSDAGLFATCPNYCDNNSPITAE